MFGLVRCGCDLIVRLSRRGAVLSSVKVQLHTGDALRRKKKLTEEEKEAKKAGRRVIKVNIKTHSEIIEIWRNMTVAEVAKSIHKNTDHVYKTMEFVKDSENYNDDDDVIDNPEVIKNILRISGYKFKFIAKPTERKEEHVENVDATAAPPAPVERLKTRPPVVTVMGHVDHGKTTLLDALRNSNVVEKEFGGITQHIGAFSVKLPTGEPVTFLDTPGHAAFSAMRARGANVTDMVVLVVAADDGVMEQTVQSIAMAKEANVPIIVAINKIDKPEADIENTKNMLSQRGIVVEDLGGEVQAIPISALKAINLDTLVEAIVLQSQIMDLKADYTGVVEGVVVEAETDLKRGKTATVIVKRGTLRKGCIVVAGLGWARVRMMFTSDEIPIAEAPPSTPVRVFGWRELPSAGDEMLEVPTEKRATQVLKFRMHNKMSEKQLSDAPVIAAKEKEHRTVYEKQLQKKRLLGRFYMKREGPMPKLFTESNEPRLNVIVKGDVDGSVEAILDVLETYHEHDQCKLDIVHYGIGDITENDVELAEAFSAIIYAFNINVLPQISESLKKKKIAIKRHNVIYKMIDDIKEELTLRIPDTAQEEILGEAKVLENFAINERRKKVANVAGCKCVKGVLKKNGLYRVIRGEKVAFEGKLTSMRHHKDEVDTIKKDIECGLKIDQGLVEFHPGDVIVCYRMINVKQSSRWNPGF